MNTTTTTTKTRLSQEEQPVETKVTVDWSNISTDDLRALATRTIIIAKQAEWRKAGEIPIECTIDAHDVANPERKPRGPVDPLTAFNRAFAAYKAANPDATRADFLASLGV